MFSSLRASQQRNREEQDRHEQNTRPGNLSIGGRLRAVHQAREECRADEERRRLEIQQTNRHDRRQREQAVEERDQYEQNPQPGNVTVGAPIRPFGQVVSINTSTREALIVLEPNSPSSKLQRVPAGVETRVGDWLPWLEDSEEVSHPLTAIRGQGFGRGFENNTGFMRWPYDVSMESWAGQTEGRSDGVVHTGAQTTYALPAYTSTETLPQYSEEDPRLNQG